MFVVSERRWRLLALALASCVVASASWFANITATAASPTVPTSMVITNIFSDNQAPIGTPEIAQPYVLVEAGGSFKVSVSFFDSTGAPASFNQDTALSITSNRGTLSPNTGTAPKNATSATLTTSLATAANQVSVTVRVASGQARGLTATSSSSQLFDVLKSLHDPETVGAGGSVGIGGDDDSCTNATAGNPVCGILSLPLGAASPVVMGLGACDATYANCGSNKGAVVQALADLGPGYTKTTPATLIVKCDKSLCGGGAIAKIHLEFSLSGNAPLGEAPPCPAKFVVGDNQDACVDYVQSKRDGSGDTHLYLLFDQDMRTSVH